MFGSTTLIFFVSLPFLPLFLSLCLSCSLSHTEHGILYMWFNLHNSGHYDPQHTWACLTQSSTTSSLIKVTLVVEGEQEAAMEEWASVRGRGGGGQQSVNGADICTGISGHLNTYIPKSPLASHQASTSTPRASAPPPPSYSPHLSYTLSFPFVSSLPAPRLASEDPIKTVSAPCKRRTLYRTDLTAAPHRGLS